MDVSLVSGAAAADEIHHRPSQMSSITLSGKRDLSVCSSSNQRSIIAMAMAWPPIISAQRLTRRANGSTSTATSISHQFVCPEKKAQTAANRLFFRRFLGDGSRQFSRCLLKARLGSLLP